MSKKIFEFLINDEDETGVKTISLVDSPAMESEFIAFNKDVKKPKYISLEKKGDKYKQVVAGLSLIPDKLIYRVDPETEEEYYGYFSQETIEKIRNKYHKEVMTSNVNLDHDEQKYVDAYLIESYVLSSDARVAEVKAQGIEGATLGAWYTQFKIEDEEIFEKVLDGDFKGFSIEAFLNREFKTVDASLKNNFNKEKTKMKKNLIENLKEKFNSFLETLETEDESKFEESLVPEEGFTLIWNEVGEVVQKRYENEAGEEVIEDVGQGEFTLEDGRIVVVDENSTLIEVQAAPEEEEEEATEEKPAEENASEETEVKAEEETEVEASTEETTEVKAEEETTEENAEEEEAAAEDGMPEAVKTWLNSVAGQFDDGEVYVSFMKQGGEFTFGSISTYANIKMSKESMSKIDELNKEVETLKEKLSEPITDPQLDDTERGDVGEVRELSVYEKIAKRKGIAAV